MNLSLIEQAVSKILPNLSLRFPPMDQDPELVWHMFMKAEVPTHMLIKDKEVLMLDLVVEFAEACRMVEKFAKRKLDRLQKKHFGENKT